MKTMFTMRFAGAAVLCALWGTAAVAQTASSASPGDVWKNAGASDGLRQAFERAVYSLKDSGHGTWRGENDAQRLTLEFDSGVARLTHPAGKVEFRLSGYGHGERLGKPTPASLTATANRLEYRRGDLTEWYVNRSQGLEQGFDLARRPAGHGDRLEIALEVTGTEAPELREGLVRVGGLRYSGLVATDGRGHALPSRMEVHGREIRLVVEDGQAQYPLVVDPTWSQQNELTASDGGSGNCFGCAVFIDGTTAIVGAYRRNGNQGAAYVFVQNGSSWTEQQELTASDAAAPNQFGFSVSLDGDTALIGSDLNPIGGTNYVGAAYVFVRSGTTWTQQAEMAPTDGVQGDEFGYSVSVSGGTAIVGSIGHGAAYVFVQSGSTWSLQEELTPSDASSNDAFGCSVSLIGETALIGAWQLSPGGGSYPGAAYVFVRGGTTWSQQAELTASDAADRDRFGYSVSLNGSTALIGAYGHTVGSNSSQGAVYVFVQSGGTWSQQTELTASDGTASDQFGYAVSLSPDIAVIGTSPGSMYTQRAGAAYVFTQSGGIWTQQQKLTASDGGTSDQFGSMVSVSGTTALIGSAKEAAYLFVPSTASLSVSATHSTPIFQGGPGAITLTVSNTGVATSGAATVSDTLDSAFTINSASSGCSISGQSVTCTIPSGTSAASTAFNIYVTASVSAAASISNTATLSDTGDTVVSGSSMDTIVVTAQAPQVDSRLTQIMLSGSTDNGLCANGNLTFTATDQIQNTSGTTLTAPYAVISSLTQGNTLLSQSASSSSVAAGANVTFTFHIQLASCSPFQLFFHVRGN